MPLTLSDMSSHSFGVKNHRGAAGDALVTVHCHSWIHIAETLLQSILGHCCLLLFQVLLAFLVGKRFPLKGRCCCVFEACKTETWCHHTFKYFQMIKMDIHQNPPWCKQNRFYSRIEAGSKWVAWSRNSAVVSIATSAALQKHETIAAFANIILHVTPVVSVWNIFLFLKYQATVCMLLKYE